MNTKTYPRTNDYQTIYLNAIINNPNIIVVITLFTMTL